MRLRLTLLFAVCLSAPAFAYDDTWYRSNGWGGEYPTGFTLTADTIMKVRASAEREAPANVDCPLRAKATYHPWNEKRVKSDALEFLTVTKIVPYEMAEDFSADVTRVSDDAEVDVDFAKGDRWNFLAYLGEGTFVLDSGGTLYQAGQDLADHARATDAAAADTAPDEWLGLTCANGARGWILIGDLALDDGVLGTPNITGYGTAEDGL